MVNLRLMSLKYTYQSFTSYLLAAVIAWNSFGYIGAMITSLAMHEMHHGEEQCEKMFCYCEVTDGMKICTCHHQNEHYNSEESDEHHATEHCVLDLNLNDYAHDASLIQWDSRTFIFYEPLTISPFIGNYKYTLPPLLTIPPGIQRILDRPPALV